MPFVDESEVGPYGVFGVTRPKSSKILKLSGTLVLLSCCKCCKNYKKCMTILEHCALKGQDLQQLNENSVEEVIENIVETYG